MKKIVYIDMDNVMVDFPSGIAKLDEKTKQEYEGRYDEVEGIFSLMEPIPNAISAVHNLMKKYHIWNVGMSIGLQIDRSNDAN